ncbi:hypothetical protein [Bacillus cytotoxicus]|uniref:hypothetical protein n=1 Tax=Bacillus cytotoxicus TaxID=580165 RepID=UPI00086439D4|nr:hypothetical protein [Bacillus cytotoxicus]AWC29121.1 hypothetical protein CG483_012800 [Bacillus cytotoxicus]AWC39493.1 hypothetical protein CG480_002450 [Bacillus cytotoxicus]AWC47424.1 hypothetical protein CG478_002450 [Bacillus cytotoxicus]AWC53192.1 hypothetical protein CG477_012760 [Bacillus cytotoxicus]AWC57321.1 hypothetical protein CG476_012785 [Bacillus cytotoxicus]
MSSSLIELSNDINVITAEINAYQRVAGEAIFEIGRRLHEVKYNPEKYGLPKGIDVEGRAIVARGAWGRWLTSVNIHERKAQRFIKVFKRFELTDTGVGLPDSLSVLEVLTDFDDEELEKPREMPDGSTKKLTEMSRREIEEFKRRERRVIEEKEAAVRAAEEAERRAEQAEEDKRKLGQLLTEERNKTPEVQYVKDTESEEQLRLYRERYGEISENVYRITNETEISGMVMEFSEHTRDFIKQYAFLKHYEGEFHALNRRSKAEYESTLNALRDFLNDVQRVVEYSKTNEQVIIDIK